MRNNQQMLAVFAVGVAAIPMEEQRDLAECTDLALEILPGLSNIPTPDLSLASFLAEQTQLATVTDPCAIPAVTGALAEDYTSYMSELVDWYEDHTADLTSLLSACSDVPEIASELQVLPAEATLCSEITWATSGPASDDNDGSDDAQDDNQDDAQDDNNDDSTNDDNTNDDSTNDDNNDDSTNDDNNDDAESDNTNEQGGNGGSAATRQTATLGAALAIAGVVVAAL